MVAAAAAARSSVDVAAVEDAAATLEDVAEEELSDELEPLVPKGKVLA